MAILGAGAVMMGSRLGDAFNFLYSIMLARWLGGGEFGSASALMLALAIPAATINVLVCRETVWRTETQQPQALRAFVWRWFWRAFAAGSVCAALIVLFNPYVGTVLRYNHPDVGYGLAALVVLTLTRPFWQSVLQGQERFLLISAGPPLEGFLRLTLTMAFLYFLQAGLRGVVAAQAITGVILLGYGMVLGIAGTRTHAQQHAPATPLPHACAPPTNWRTLAASLTITTALILFISTDVIVVNFIFPGPIADAYAAIATLGKIVLYVPESLAVIMLPIFVRDAAHARSSTRATVAAVAIALAGAAAITLLFALCGTALMRAVYPQAYLAYAHLLPWYAVAMGGVALCRMLGTQAMARGLLAPGVALLAVAALQVLGFYLFRLNVGQTTIVLVITSLAAAVVSAAMALVRAPWRGTHAHLP